MNLQTQTLYKTHLAQGSAIAPLSSPYIPIAEAARKRAVNGLVPKTTTPEVPDAVAGGASYTVAPSSFASSPEISVGRAMVLMPTFTNEFFLRFYATGLYGTSVHGVVRLIAGSIAKLS